VIWGTIGRCGVSLLLGLEPAVIILPAFLSGKDNSTNSVSPSTAQAQRRSAVSKPGDDKQWKETFGKKAQPTLDKHSGRFIRLESTASRSTHDQRSVTP
jgi:hypothetical protein